MPRKCKWSDKLNPQVHNRHQNASLQKKKNEINLNWCNKCTLKSRKLLIQFSIHKWLDWGKEAKSISESINISVSPQKFTYKHIHPMSTMWCFSILKWYLIYHKHLCTSIIFNPFTIPPRPQTYSHSCGFWKL